MSAVRSIKRSIKRYFGLEPTETQKRLIRKLRANANGDIRVVGRGGLMKSARSVKKSDIYREAIRHLKKDANKRVATEES